MELVPEALEGFLSGPVSGIGKTHSADQKKRKKAGSSEFKTTGPELIGADCFIEIGSYRQRMGQQKSEMQFQKNERPFDPSFFDASR
jgi:hypothetical protein